MTCLVVAAVRYDNTGDYNTESFLPSEIGLLANLTTLVMSSNAMKSGTIPTELGRLSNLQLLNLDAYGLKGTLPTELDNRSRLSILYMDGNRSLDPFLSLLEQWLPWKY